jgi:predicted chitinase
MDEEQKRLAEASEANAKMEQERQAGIEAGETAEDTAAQVTKVGVPDENGNVTPMSDFIIPDYTAAIPGQQINASETQQTGTPPAGPPPAQALSNDVIEQAYYDNSVSTDKVLKALKPELEAAGITDPKEQKVFLKQKMVEIGIPTINTGASKSEQGKQRRIKDQWAANYPARIEAKKDLPKENINVDQSSQSNIDPNQLGAPSTEGKLGVTTTGTETLDPNRVDVAGRDAERDTGAEKAQRAALKQTYATEGEAQAVLDSLLDSEKYTIAKKGDAYAIKSKATKLTPQLTSEGYNLLQEQNNNALPAWKDLTPEMKDAFMPKIEGALKTKGLLAAKGATPQVDPEIAAAIKMKKQNEAVVSP